MSNYDLLLSELQSNPYARAVVHLMQHYGEVTPPNQGTLDRLYGQVATHRDRAVFWDWQRDWVMRMARQYLTDAEQANLKMPEGVDDV